MRLKQNFSIFVRGKQTMRLISKFKKLWVWPWKFKLLLLEAIWLSFLNEFYLKAKIYSTIKSQHFNHPNSSNLTDQEIKTMLMVSKSMKLLEKFAPWKPKCYNRVLTAKKMLSKRNIHTRMHIGFRKINDQFDGHAWLTYKDRIVTGFIKGISEFNKLEGKDFLQKEIL